MGLFRTAKSVLVVDTSAMLKVKGMRGRAAPRQQRQLLRALSRMVQREKLNVTAVLVGEPLDRVPHNHLFEGVRVRYAASEEVLNQELIKSLKQAGSSGVLVIEDLALETRVLRSGRTVLRISTFCNLLDDGNEAGEFASERPPRNHRDRDRGPRRNRGRNNQPTKPPSSDQEGIGTKNRNDRKSSDDTVRQMIDLVD